MADSVHLGRWVAQLDGTRHVRAVFPVSEAEPHPLLRHVKVFRRIASPFRSVALKLIEYLVTRGKHGFSLRTMPNPYTPQRLARAIARFKPDVVHSLEFQHSSYLALEAKRIMGRRFPPWIVTNWGSDIFLFGRLAEHAPQIRKVLAECDYYHCECARDVDLALKMGFAGTVLPVAPSGGGFDLTKVAALRQPGRTSARRLIVVKGYQHWAGRALVALRALARCKEDLQGYRILIHSPSGTDVAIATELLRQELSIPVEWIPPVQHAKILEYYGQARIGIGLSISDGISTSFLETLVMGAFPIQSFTACADEWVTDGRTGLLVPPEDPDKVADALRRALRDDALIDSAVAVNDRVVADRLSWERTRQQVISMYDSIATQRAGTNS